MRRRGGERMYILRGGMDERFSSLPFPDSLNSSHFRIYGRLYFYGFSFRSFSVEEKYEKGRETSTPQDVVGVASDIQ